MTAQEFNEIYWNSFPPEVRALRDMYVDAWRAPAPDDKPGGRTELATKLAGAGHVLDVNIHVCGQDPYQTMAIRQLYGWADVPCYLGSARIKTTLKSSDFPPFDKPAPPVEKPLVGIHLYANVYAAGPGDSPSTAIGTVCEQQGMRFIKRGQASPFGTWGVFWELLSR